MDDYQKAMLKLKFLELTQRQALIAIAAHGGPPEIIAEAEAGAAMLAKAIETVGKLI